MSVVENAAAGSIAAAVGNATVGNAAAENAGSNQDFRPKVLAFTCNWCTYAGADLAGLNRMNYPADVRLLRVPCSGRVNPQYVLEALQKGCDGVIVCGCHPGDCHYATGNYYAKRRMMVYKRMMEYIGLEPDRFQIRWISGAEAGKFRDVITAFVDRIKELGPIQNDFTLDEGIAAGMFGNLGHKPVISEKAAAAAAAGAGAGVAGADTTASAGASASASGMANGATVSNPAEKEGEQ